METDKIMATVGVSNRHVHLTKETYDLLFNEVLSIKRPVNQIGEFAANQTLTLEGPKGKIENVRVMGPYRSYNQVEIARSDALTLGIDAPVRTSGDLEDSADITLIGPIGRVHLESACIQAERHVHINKKRAAELGLVNEDIVNLIVSTDKGGIMEAFVKVTDNGYFEVHIDKDDANAFLLQTGDEVEIQK